MSSSAMNEAAVRSTFESAARGRFDAFDALLAPDYVLHPEEIRGVDGLTEMVEGYRRAMPDLRITIDQQFSEGDDVATRFTVRGTHSGELMGVEPTGRAVEFSGITISRCRDGRIVEEWELVDAVGLLRQVGAIPGAAVA